MANNKLSDEQLDALLDEAIERLTHGFPSEQRNKMAAAIEQLRTRCQELEKRLFTKARFTKTHENAYTDEELLEMFGPFILEGCTTGLSPRECRLLETIADANAQLASVTAERDEMMEALKMCDDHLDGCSHGYPDKLYDAVQKLVYTEWRDTP